jgi:hypothetical protein
MENRQQVLRIAAGFLLAPLLPCAAFSAMMSAIAGQWSGFLFGVIAVLVVTEVLSIAVALPLYLILRRFRRIGALECAVSGVAVTVLLNVATLFLSPGPGYSAGDGGGDTIVNGHITAHGYVSALSGTVIQSSLGVAIGLCFWFIAIRRTSGA